MTIRENWRLIPRRHKIALVGALLAAVAISQLPTHHVSIPSPPSELTPEQRAAQEKADAKLYAKMADATSRMINSAGYDCSTVDNVSPTFSPEGFRVRCNHYRYAFTIENHGGKWSVKAD
jgi:hypothetical protein